MKVAAQYRAAVISDDNLYDASGTSKPGTLSAPNPINPPPVPGTAIGLAADLHLAAAMPVARYVEYITPAPYIDELVAEPFVLNSDGMLAIPTGPGLGIQIDEDALARLSERD